MSQSCNQILAFYMENAFGRILLVGRPLWGEEKVPFYIESSKKSINLGNGECNHFEFSDKKCCEPHKNCPGQSYFYILSLSSLFLWWRASGNILCIYSCNLTASRFPDLPWYCKIFLLFRCANTNAWQIPGNNAQIILFSFALFSTSEAAQGAPEIHFHILCLTREVTSIFYISIHTRYEPINPATKSWHLISKIDWGEHRSWGDPFVTKKTGSFLYRK